MQTALDDGVKQHNQPNHMHCAKGTNSAMIGKRNARKHQPMLEMMAECSQVSRGSAKEPKPLKSNATVLGM